LGTKARQATPDDLHDYLTALSLRTPKSPEIKGET
jgi:hypothetical protein